MINIFENIIDERMPMEATDPQKFDQYLNLGWRLLGYSFIRHNITFCRGEVCNTTPLRIRLNDFKFSASQQKLLRKQSGLRVEFGEIEITSHTEWLFERHCERLTEQKPASIFSFLSPHAASVPVKGLEIRLFEGDLHFASSFIHLGDNSVSGTYCVFVPDMAHYSPGSLTMLLELQYAQQNGYEYYYHGYVNTVPSQFDYKLNYHSLESFDWETAIWSPRERVAVKNWKSFL